jgi:hypothetical protein
MTGVPVRVHDLYGDDLGIAHLPPPIAIGDLIALEGRELRVVDVVERPPNSPLAALVQVRPVHLRPLLA